jgi:hypothetical protein
MELNILAGEYTVKLTGTEDATVELFSAFLIFDINILEVEEEESDFEVPIIEQEPDLDVKEPE